MSKGGQASRFTVCSWEGEWVVKCVMSEGRRLGDSVGLYSMSCVEQGSLVIKCGMWDESG